MAHAVGLSSGTAALHLALVSWGVGPGDVVPVSTFTFAATVNAIRYVGAEPFFVDCDEETGNMSPDLLEQAVKRLRRGGTLGPRHRPGRHAGQVRRLRRHLRASPRPRVHDCCADAAESFGASYNGRAAGSFGDASVISFNGNKIMTTSGGGMLLTE